MSSTSFNVSTIKRAAKSRKGQALVESAIVIPLMTFIILGVLQLAMIQHARIMTEYAAFNSARSGIVWNADKFVMENAAILSLLPTYEGLFSESSAGDPMKMLIQTIQRALIYQVHRRVSDFSNLIRSGTDILISGLPTDIQGSASTFRDSVLGAAEGVADTGLRGIINSIFGDDGKIVTVDIITPKIGDFGGVHSTEIDFDSVREDDSWRDKTRLSIRVTYLYTLRIPFANRIIHTAFIAGQVGQELYGAVWNPQMTAGETGFRNVSPVNLSGRGTALIQALWSSANEGVFMIPLRSTYTMRMQSNPYRRSVAIF
ncbi:MAG: pilus assembly protein [Deltaproteobacteria bacterium]|nr:pilus assembly protein [Deltaproteobacteria bacterium]